MQPFRNLPYKVAALLVAGVLWASAQGIRSVEQSLDLPIFLEEVPEDVVVVGQSTTEVNLRIMGSRAAVRRAGRLVTRYPISLAGVRPGEARFAVETNRLSLPRGARVTARSPSTVTVRLEPRARKRVRVRPNLVGEVPEGYRLVGVDVEPEEVVLEGSKRALRNLREVTTDQIELGSLSGSVEREVHLALRSPDVWRADDGGPIRVRVRVERLELPGQGSGAESGDAGKGEEGA